jgi:hypothetical protein
MFSIPDSFRAFMCTSCFLFLSAITKDPSKVDPTCISKLIRLAKGSDYLDDTQLAEVKVFMPSAQGRAKSLQGVAPPPGGSMPLCFCHIIADSGA